MVSQIESQNKFLLQFVSSQREKVSYS